MDDMKNLMWAVLLSVVVLFVYYTFIAAPVDQEALQQQGAEQATGTADDTLGPDQDVLPETALPEDDVLTPAAGPGQAAPESSERVTIDSTRLKGSISPVGVRFDDVVLKDYFDKIGEGAVNIVLFRPEKEENAYFVDFGWRTSPGVELPGPGTLWRSSAPTLTTEEPVEFSWQNSQGISFRQIISIDENFMFTVRQVVENNSGSTISVAPKSEITRLDTPKTRGFFILHEGPLGVLNGDLVDSDVDYNDLQEDTCAGDQRRFEGCLKQNASSGWLGFTDKYWLSSLIPDQGQPFQAWFTYGRANTRDVYKTIYRQDSGVTVAPGAAAEFSTNLFAGAKEVKLIEAYEKTLEIPKFYLAIDWGWFWFLTRPIFYILDFFFGVIGNFGVAILLLTVIIKIVLFPLANKSYRAMSRMKKLQPKMKQIKERYADDKVRMQQETMALYQKEKVNPAAGCLPMFIQIPVFFALYKTLFVTIEMRQQPFFGWIHDLSAPDPLTLITGFGLIDWNYPGWLSFLAIGIWPLIMGLSMWFQQKLNPSSPDPIQAKVFAFMPIFFTFILAAFPVGLVIYWTWNNLLSIAQQWVIMRQEGVKITDG